MVIHPSLQRSVELAVGVSLVEFIIIRKIVFLELKSRRFVLDF